MIEIWLTNLLLNIYWIKRNLVEIKGSLHDHVFDKLDERRLRLLEEDKKIRENKLCKLYALIIYAEMHDVLERTRPKMRNRWE